MDASSFFVDTVVMAPYAGVAGARADPTNPTQVSVPCRFERGRFTYIDVTGLQQTSDAQILTDVDTLNLAIAAAGLTASDIGPLDVFWPPGADATKPAQGKRPVRIDRVANKDRSYELLRILL